MARPEKVALVDEVERTWSDSAALLLADYRGLTVSEMSALRAELRKTSATCRIVKNTMTKRAADRLGVDGLDDVLTGPTALVFCDEDPVGPAKALRAFAKDHPALEVKGGFVEGEVLIGADAERLADLESREELLSRFVGLLYGALANTARLLQAPLAQQARLVQALIDAGGPGAAGESTAPTDTDAASSDGADADDGS